MAALLVDYADIMGYNFSFIDRAILGYFFSSNLPKSILLSKNKNSHRNSLRYRNKTKANSKEKRAT